MVIGDSSFNRVILPKGKRDFRALHEQGVWKQREDLEEPCFSVKIDLKSGFKKDFYKSS